MKAAARIPDSRAFGPAAVGAEPEGILRSGRRGMAVLWSDRRFGLAIAGSLAIAAAFLSAWLTPRGPITTLEALVSMAAALAVGLAAGVAMGSRWSALITSIVFIAILEVARLGVDGPTVDGIHPGSLYGLMALVLGRGVHGLLVIRTDDPWQPPWASSWLPAWGRGTTAQDADRSAGFRACSPSGCSRLRSSWPVRQRRPRSWALTASRWLAALPN